MTGFDSESSYANAIVRTITQPLLVLDKDLRVESANPAFLRQFSVSKEDTVGQLICDLGNKQWDIPELRRLLDEVLEESRTVEAYRVEHEFETLGKRTMLLNANRMARDGAPDRILVAITDITERERLQFQLEGKRDFAEKLIDSVRESLLILNWELQVRTANQSFYEHFQVTPQETEGRPIWELGNGQWNIPRLRTFLEDILPRETSFDDFKVEHEFENIGRRIMLLNARRLDHMNLILLAIRDVTELRDHETQQKAFMDELRHRVNNILNNVRALATQTRRSTHTFEQFFAAFEMRLDALARAQDLLVRSPSQEVALHDIIRTELEAMGALEGKQYSATGPELRFSPQSSQAMAMTIHELATNAAKYGALKAERGSIELKWRIERTNGRKHFSFGWRESGVLIRNTDPERGFGSRVIEGSLAHMLGGKAQLVFHPEGVQCSIEFPLPD